MNNPLVSIIIPTYNRADLLPETLDSVLAQTYQNWECIIVDDGSTDHTKEVVATYNQKDKRISYQKRPEHYLSGGNGARNYGFEISKGEFIYWFDSDDLMKKENLSLHVDRLIKSGKDFSVCKVSHFKNNHTTSGNYNINSKNLLLDYLNKKFIVFLPSIVFRKKFLEKNSFRFNESLKAAQEWEFFVKVFSDFNDYFLLDYELSNIRQHSKQMSTDNSILYQRTYNYILARKIAKKYLIKSKKYSKEIDGIFQNFGSRFIPILIKGKQYKLLNKAIFCTGFTLDNIKSFLSIYFLIITKKNKANTNWL